MSSRDDGYLLVHPLPDGRVLFVFDLTFGRAKLGIGDDRRLGLDDEW